MCLRIIATHTISQYHSPVLSWIHPFGFDYGDCQLYGSKSPRHIVDYEYFLLVLLFLPLAFSPLFVAHRCVDSVDLSYKIKSIVIKSLTCTIIMLVHD